MRKLSFFLAFLMVLALSTAAFSQCVVTFSDPTNVWDDGGTVTLVPGQTHQVFVTFTAIDCSGGSGGFNVANSYKIYSPGSAVDWGYFKGIMNDTPTCGIEADLPSFRWSSIFCNHFYWDGSAWQKTADSINEGSDFPPGPLVETEAAPGAGMTDSGCISVAAFSQNAAGGFKQPYDNVVYIMEFHDGGNPADVNYQGDICIDTCTPSGGGTWQWVYITGGITAANFYDQPVCYPVKAPPNLPPVPDCGSGTATFSHCGVASLDFTATDPDGDNMTWTASEGTITFNADGTSAHWEWSTLPQSGFVTLTVAVSDGINPPVECVTELTITNDGPTISCPTAVPTVIVGQAANCQTVTVGDDCDALTVTSSAQDVTTSDNGDGTWDICFQPTDPTYAANGQYDLPVVVSDGEKSATCNVSWNVLHGSPYSLTIEKLHDVIQGQFYDVCVTLDQVDTDPEVGGIGGFDLLIAYDNSALSFQQAFEGDIYTDCDWEYFTYRFGANGNCSGGCPSGLTRLIGIAETNNGAHHPGCQPLLVDNTPVTLACMRFLVSNDRTFECQYVPIRFFWVDCGDNALSNASGSRLLLSAQVFDYGSTDPIQDTTYGFPGYVGAPHDCFINPAPNKPLPIRYVDFQNGGIDIVCSDSIDARGDINLNGQAYEIADAVMFTNYFVSGLSAFGNPAYWNGAIAASDVNADGLTLTVADLVYLIRVVVGDALPYPKLNPMHANYSLENNTLSVNSEMGAAHLVFQGKVTPTLLAKNMTMKVGTVDGNTSVLVYSTEANQVFEGNFLSVDGSLISADFATYDGQPVAAKNVPQSFRVEQNYPNPFNPSTKISFALPTASKWVVDIFNVTGQRVQSFEGSDDAGEVVVTWDASKLASGVYFYRVTAGTNSQTMKAILLK
jgi:hypothetical protein